MLPVALAICAQTHAQTTKPFFHNPEALPKEFDFDLEPAVTFLQEYPPGSRLIAKPPATLTMEFQLTEARRDAAFPQFPPSVSLWLVSADDVWGARIQIADDPRAATMMMQVKYVDRRTSEWKNLLVDVTGLKKGAVNIVYVSVGKGGSVKVRAPDTERTFQLPFTPTRLGAAVMGAKGWMRFPDSPIVS
jgi:hypothetical protein